MMCKTHREVIPGVPGALQGESPGGLPGAIPGALGLSVIVPARNEAGTIGKTLESVMAGTLGCRPELIVVDGSSTDDTRHVAESMGATVISTQPGRAKQMNAGAAAATGDTLLFLHADTLLPPDYPRHIRDTLAQPGVVGGAFELYIDAPNRSLRVIEWCVNLRSRWRSLPYGDQGLFMRADTFEQLGGYADLPIMEDYELVRRLARLGRIRLARASVKTSARRWLQQGIICATLTNQACIIGYHLGITPCRLAAWRNGRCARQTHTVRNDHNARSHHGSDGADRQRSAQASGR